MRRHVPDKSRSSYTRQEPLYDTTVATPTHAERARTLAAAIGTGTLCTLTKEPEGHPYGSFVTYGLDNGEPVFLVSALAEHTHNLNGDKRASLLIAEPGEGDPLSRARVTLVGTAQKLARGEDTSAREAFLAEHSNAAYYVDFEDFAFWRMSVDRIRYIGGYGRMSWVEPAEWSTSAPDPTAAFTDRIIAHMNDDHADTMVLYCKAFSKAVDIDEAKMTGVDQYGFEMSVTTPTGPRPVRLAFGAPALTAKDVRVALVALAAEAREKLGLQK
ncbi:MAG: putative heme iron utilization protein [Myxococcota bacterium]|jgi:putative heme iron utilization protein